MAKHEQHDYTFHAMSLSLLPDRAGLEEGKASLHEENEERNNDQEELIILFSQQIKLFINGQIAVLICITFH